MSVSGTGSNGFPAASHQYARLMDRISDRVHVIALDYPGFGYTHDDPAPVKRAGLTREEITMSDKQRLSVHDVDPEAYKPMLAMEKYIHAGTLGEPLLALVKIRASQINGCAWCLDMHNKEARKAQVPQRKLDVLAGWSEAPGLYSERERAAIALTEEVTLISVAGVSDAVWDKVTESFQQKEIVQLLMAIAAINVWNRLAVSTHQDLPAG